MARKIPRLAQTKIRLPTALRRDLQREADKYKRPLNVEIIERLELSFQRQMTASLINEAAKKAAEEMLDQLAARREPIPLSELGKRNKEDKS
jgi:hypothetical protein